MSSMECGKPGQTCTWAVPALDLGKPLGYFQEEPKVGSPHPVLLCFAPLLSLFPGGDRWKKRDLCSANFPALPEVFLLFAESLPPAPGVSREGCGSWRVPRGNFSQAEEKGGRSRCWKSRELLHFQPGAAAEPTSHPCREPALPFPREQLHNPTEQSWGCLEWGNVGAARME